MILLEQIRNGVKWAVRQLAQLLNQLSHGHITPNQVTIMGLLAHIPLAFLIGSGHYHWAAAIFLAIFGLFDTLDGELARLQKTTSLVGMFLDSATDRLKEIMIYAGIMASFAPTANRTLLVVCIGALGASLCTSYLNAWGEVVISQSNHHPNHHVNKTFRSGLLGFDLRMVLIIIGLVSNRLELIMYVILILATVTILQRFWNITRTLQS